MPKNYSLRYLIDDTSAKAAYTRGVKGFADIEAAALKAAVASEKVFARTNAAATTAAATQAKSANAITGSTNRVAAAVEAGARRRVQAEVAAQERIDVGYYKLAVAGLKMQDKLTRDAERGAAQRAAIEDRYAMRDYQRRVQQERNLANFALGPNGRNAQRQALSPRGMLDGSQIGLAAQVRAVDVLNKKAVDARLKMMGLNDSFAEGIKQGTGFEQMATKAGVALMGVEAGRKIIDGVADAFKSAKDAADAFGRGTLDKFRELRASASVEGTRPDAAYARKVAEFGIKAGMSGNEASQFRESFMGRAQIVKGKTLDENEFEKFAEMSGALVSAKGIPLDVGGDLMGSVLKTENFKNRGQGAKEAFARGKSAIDILDAGSGKMPILGPQFTQLSSLTRESGLEGVFRNAAEQAVATSVAAEHDPGEAAVTVNRYSQALRKFDDKEIGPALKKAGITDKDSFLEATAKMNKVIEAEVSKGVPVDTAIKNIGFHEQREVRGAKTFFGARDTVLKAQTDRMNAGLGPEAAVRAQSDLEEMKKTETFKDSQSKAIAERAKTIAGISRTGVTIAKQKAEADVVPDDMSVWAQLRRAGKSAATLGRVSGRDIEIEESAVKNNGGAGGFADALSYTPWGWGASGARSLTGMNESAIQAGQGNGNDSAVVDVLSKILIALTGGGKTKNTPAPIPIGRAKASPIRP